MPCRDFVPRTELDEYGQDPQPGDSFEVAIAELEDDQGRIVGGLAQIAVVNQRRDAEALLMAKEPVEVLVERRIVEASWAASGSSGCSSRTGC